MSAAIVFCERSLVAIYAELCPGGVHAIAANWEISTYTPASTRMRITPPSRRLTNSPFTPFNIPAVILKGWPAIRHD